MNNDKDLNVYHPCRWPPSRRIGKLDTQILTGEHGEHDKSV